jgi:hypothetical protein
VYQAPLQSRHYRLRAIAYIKPHRTLVTRIGTDRQFAHLLLKTQPNCYRETTATAPVLDSTPNRSDEREPQ